MFGSGYFLRLLAALAAAGLLGAAILKPDGGRRAVETIAGAAPAGPALAEMACPRAGARLTHAFAPIDDVLSVSPLGGVTAPGETLPAPHLRVNMRRGEQGFERRTARALAPARADIVAIERRIERDADGRAVKQSWTVRLKPCASIALYYDRLDSIEPSILRRAGGLAIFTEIGGPDHVAIETRVRLRAGETIGEAKSFDVGLYDFAVTPAPMERPERYRANPYAHAAALNAPASLMAAIAPDIGRARCALDYFPDKLRAEWTAKLGDAWGMRSVRGEDACRTALLDVRGSAQGAWFTDASLGALTTKVSAIALAPDSIDADRLIFALHGRLRSLKPEMIAFPPGLEEERARAARDFVSFDKGSGRINTPFAEAREGPVYCYERLRANFVGPRINAVLLLQLAKNGNGATLMKLEARGDALSCIDLAEPWSFTGAETTFYR